MEQRIDGGAGLGVTLLELSFNSEQVGSWERFGGMGPQGCQSNPFHEGAGVTTSYLVSVQDPRNLDRRRPYLPWAGAVWRSANPAIGTDSPWGLWGSLVPTKQPPPRRDARADSKEGWKPVRTHVGLVSHVGREPSSRASSGRTSRCSAFGEAVDRPLAMSNRGANAGRSFDRCQVPLALVLPLSINRQLLSCCRVDDGVAGAGIGRSAIIQHHQELIFAPWTALQTRQDEISYRLHTPHSMHTGQKCYSISSSQPSSFPDAAWFPGT